MGSASPSSQSRHVTFASLLSCPALGDAATRNTSVDATKEKGGVRLAEDSDRVANENTAGSGRSGTMSRIGGLDRHGTAKRALGLGMAMP